jgi:hypothetical protein
MNGLISARMTEIGNAIKWKAKEPEQIAENINHKYSLNNFNNQVIE